MRDRVQALGGSLRSTAARGRGRGRRALFPLRGPVAGSVVGALQVEQDGGDAAVEVELLGEPSLRKMALECFSTDRSVIVSSRAMAAFPP
jgi:hypothetical protein